MAKGKIMKSIGIIISNKIIAEAEPMRVKIIASCAWPLSKNSCPGKTERAVSSSGAPR